MSNAKGLRISGSRVLTATFLDTLPRNLKPSHFKLCAEIPKCQSLNQPFLKTAKPELRRSWLAFWRSLCSSRALEELLLLSGVFVCLSASLPKGPPTYPNGIYFGLKVTLYWILWAQSMCCLGTWTLTDSQAACM